MPEILARFHVAIATLAWVLTAFNLALALAALPAAFLARRRAGLVFGVGTVVFAAASLVCAFVPSFGVLVAGRALQGVAGAAVVCAALQLLSQVTGADASAARVWILAGIAGAALGPAAGGILTQLLGWESIFIVQAPAVLVGLLVLRRVRWTVSVPEPVERPNLGANAALLLVSGALVAALFLLVILLINGWRLDPLPAGIVVTVMPAAAIAAIRMGSRIAFLWVRAASGVILIAGGLAALGWLPRAGWGWTVAPQLAIGTGLGLAVSALSERALAGRSAQAVHGGWTIAARHAGVVLGLVVLTPLFTTDLHRSEDNALAAGTAAVLDSRIAPLQKIGVARNVLVAVNDAKAEARIPDIHQVVDNNDDPAYGDLATALQDQLDRAVTNSCSRAFLAAALLALAALVPILFVRRDGGALMRTIALATAAAVTLIVVYLALGGASYSPAKVADPCLPRASQHAGGVGGVAEQVVLSAIDGAACKLGVSREAIVLAFANRASLRRFARQHHITGRQLEELLRAGLLRAVDDAERAGALDPTVANLVRGLVRRVPVGGLLDLLQQLPG